MGQYHRIYNLDKNETISCIAGGVKLIEYSSDYFTMTAFLTLLCNSSGRGGGDLCVETQEYKDGKFYPIKGSQAHKKTLDEISGRWAGDRIVIQGDYVKRTDPAYVSGKQLQKMNDITQLCVDALRAAKLDLDQDQGFQITKRFGRLR